MNQRAEFPPGDPATKRRFTVDEFERMGMAGVFGPDERVELIGGEIYVMSPAGRFHEVLRSELSVLWSRMSTAQGVKVVPKTPLRLSDDHQPVVDILVYPGHLLSPDVRGNTALLVVEIADSSWKLDTTVKASAYAAANVLEYWVIDARSRTTLVHREPTRESYAVKFEIPADAIVTPLLVPELAVRMCDLAGA
jgi:Uma2 family endonuclease